MERTWFSFDLCLLISLFQLCNGLPIPAERAIIATDPSLQLVSSIIAIGLTLCTLMFIAGCLCCYGRNGFKEFHDAPITLSGSSSVDNGLVNPTAEGPFTIFTPISQNLAGSNKFLLDEQFVYGDINVSSWFNETERDFPRSKLKYIRELGRGWFGKIVQGTAQNVERDVNEWTPVVVRILDSTASTKERVYFLHEVNIYKCGEHTNILKLFGRCLDSVPYLLLQEYCPQGDLKNYLISNKTADSSNLVSSEYPLIWCCQLTSALKFLHEFGLAHLDLACRNCQLTSNLTLKLGDYGLAPSKYPEDYYDGGSGDQISPISVRWCAPESIKYTSSTIQSERVTREANIWSLGVCFWEICECGNRPYSDLSDDEVITFVHGKSNIRLPRPSYAVLYTDYIYRLMQSCWSTLESRPTANQIYPTLTDLLQVFTQFKSENSLDSQESFDSRWNSLKPNNAALNQNSNVTEWIKFNVSEPEFFEDSFDESRMRRSSSSETEDENWKTKIERGVYSEKVRQKSRSVADLMVLTHIDCSESESETPFQSLTTPENVKNSPLGSHYKNVRLAPKNLEKMSQVHGSEGNLLNVENDFEIELRKLHEEHKDSLIFDDHTSRLSERLKELSSTTSEIEPKNQVYNVFNVKINTNLSPVHVTLNEIINLNETPPQTSCNNYEVPKLCDIIENNSNISGNWESETLQGNSPEYTPIDIRENSKEADANGCEKCLPSIEKQTETDEHCEELNDIVENMNLEEIQTEPSSEEMRLIVNLERSETETLEIDQVRHNGENVEVEPNSRLEKDITEVEPHEEAEEILQLNSSAGNVNVNCEQVPEQSSSKTEPNDATSSCQSSATLYQVPKLIDLIENNDTLMDYIITNYESELHDDLSFCENNNKSTSNEKKPISFNLNQADATYEKEAAPTMSNNLDYSLETWDNFLGDAIDNTQNRFNGDDTFVFENIEDNDTSWREDLATPPNSDVNSLEEEKSDNSEKFDLNSTFEVDKECSGTWESDEGWFLHPQSSCTGQMTKNENRNGVDDELLALLRGELIAKLPHAQGSSDKRHEEVYEISDEEEDETYLKYKIYNTPLSPIPEESEDEIENDASETCTTPGSPDSGESDDWPERFLKQQNDDDDDDEDENDNSQSLKTQDLPQILHQSSQDSCCSNDTLFNFEDMTIAVENEEAINNDDSKNEAVDENCDEDEDASLNETFNVVKNENKDEGIDDNVLNEDLDDFFKVLTDIRFSGPCGESHLMSTSFSESNNEQDWDSGSDTRSTSSSGEFIWKEGEHEESLKALKALPQDTDDPIYENKDEKRTVESSGESNYSDEEGECPEFIPSAWDKHALPIKSAMRSPEKTLERQEKKKGVWFKKQRYHCVYEYPKEPESPVLQSFDLWNNPPAVTSYPDWYFDIDSAQEEFKGFPSKPETDFNTTCFNEEFFVTSSSTPFDMMMSVRGGGTSSQFFPGLNNNNSEKLDDNNTTPDSGVDDLMSSSTPPENYEIKPFLMLPTLKNLAENAYKKSQQKDRIHVSGKERSNEILGGLRHTRDKLKLDLPLSPNTFSTSKKNQFSFDTNEEQRPSFTTFGKSRFSVQQINDVDIANVCFEALPHKPPLFIGKTVEKGEANVLDSADEDSGIESSTLERKSDRHNVVGP